MNRKTTHQEGTLYIIGTPIGNIRDITLRALDVLRKDLDTLYCENTRRTRKLLSHYDIRLPLRVYTENNEERKIPEIDRLLQKGKKVGLVTNAGMPVISDPGYKLVRYLKEKEYNIDIIPGPTAVTNALILSAMPPDKFFFGGFLPEKRGKRKKALEEVKGLKATLLFYLSPYKVQKTLEDVYEVLGNRKICLVREMTKVFQEERTYMLKDYLQIQPSPQWKGELVLAIDKPD